MVAQVVNEFPNQPPNLPLALEQHRFEAGQILAGKYQVVSTLGHGGMGTVYRVHNMFIATDFALKTLENQQITDSSTVRRFQTEAKTASLLNHPNLVQVHDFGLLDDGRPYLVMDFVDGITLAEQIKQKGLMEVEYAIKLFTQISRGLAYAHERGVIHRDIKPTNIMLVNGADWNAAGSVKVVDFGIAKLMSSEEGEIQALTKTGEIFGSPLYMSPEQCSGAKIDNRCDVYSLGCVLFECLTGAPPHMGQNALATLVKHQSEEPLALTEASLGRSFPAAVQQIVSKMLKKDPRERYETMTALTEDLEAVFSNKPIGSLPASKPDVRQAEPRQKSAISVDKATCVKILIFTSVCFLLIGAAAGYLLRMQQNQNSQNLSRGKNPSQRTGQ